MERPPPPLSPNNLAFLEGAYDAYRRDPASVSAPLAHYFASLDARALLARPPAAPAPAPAAPASAPRPRSAAAVGDHAAVLRGIPLLAGLSDEDLGRVAALAEPVAFAPGEVICREGEIGQELYVVTSGAVLVRKGPQVIAELGPGEVVGELAVLDSRPRSADVIAHGAVSLLRLRGEDFQDLLRRQGDLARRLLGVLASRVRDQGARQERADQLVRAYRERGHTIADLDPLGQKKRAEPSLELSHFGFTDQDLDEPFAVDLGAGTKVLPLRRIHEVLRNTYCRAIGVQYMHIEDLAVQRWLQQQMEPSENRRSFSRESQLRILSKLTDAETFEAFLHRKFVGAKRFSLEGAESLIPLLDHAVEAAGAHGIDEIVIGMAHRGRLNVLANVLGKPTSFIFREFQDLDGARKLGRGDVKYHLGHSSDRVTASGRKVHLSLSFNPSHLEFIGPVVAGRTRAKQDRFQDREGSRALALLIHGDAAFAGQGVVQELLNMSELPGYRTGGTIHVILNNQIGFTTPPEEGRSSTYATDVARMLQIPIFHVNGEHPEAVHQVIHLAMEFRSRFHRDVVIDMYCYRRYGHNEGDDPSFTQPLLYRAIERQRSVRAGYVESLLALGGITRAEADEIAARSQARLEADLAEAQRQDFQYEEEPAGRGFWRPFVGGEARSPDLRTPRSRLQELLLASTRVPEGFHPYAKIARFLHGRQEMARGQRPLDWGAAEALAFATLCTAGHRVRLSGQDVGRGTFSHRHAVLHDTETGERYVPLQHLQEGQAPFEVYNSPLSEVAVLGFDFGYSLDYPDALVLWEAQFGDFCNVAQVIIDQFIVSSEDKWNRMSGLTLLLPHGFDGQGPEHSSARLERFLSLCAEDNIRVVNLTTPAQIYHCLRRQVLEPRRKPLVVMSPKLLLRHPEAVSTLDELAEGRFQRVIPDGTVPPGGVRRVLLTSGKLHYELAAARKARAADPIAIVRIEQYYPFPEEELLQALAPYPASAELLWVQEEPVNMGPWPFLRQRVVDRLAAAGRPIRDCIARPESASPATGSHAAHLLEQQEILVRALK